MRRPNHQMPAFSISALDLFASALGTFVLLTILLFPYYIQHFTTQDRVAELKQQLADKDHNLTRQNQQLDQLQQNLAQYQNQHQQLQKLQTALKQAQQQPKPVVMDNSLKYQQKLSQCQQQRQQCEAKLSQTFLTVVMKWQTERQDVDLHVKDPGGSVFFYKKHNRGGVHFASPAELSVDSVKGPGIEIWEHPNATAGRYHVYANLYDRVGNADNPVIKSTLYYRGGSQQLPTVRLTAEEQLHLIATFYVHNNGKVSLE